MLNTKLLSLIVSFLCCLVLGFSFPLCDTYWGEYEKNKKHCAFRQVPCLSLVIALFLSPAIEGSDVGDDVDN